MSYSDITSRFKSKFETVELQIIVPFYFLFFAVSLISSVVSPFYFSQQSKQFELFWFSLIPTIIYGLLFFVVFFKPEKVNDFLYRYRKPTGANEYRKNALCQALILLVIAFASFGFFDGSFWWLQQNEWAVDGVRLAFLSILIFFCLLIVFLLNWISPSNISRSLFIAILFAAFSLVDTPLQTVQGRSLIYQLVPIFLSSFLVAPIASVITAFLSISVMTYRSMAADIGINSTAYLGILLISLIIWIIASGWETALRESQAINQNLEKIVVRRTKQLTSANEFKSVFLAQIAHELQSPIIAFSMFLRRIKGQIDPNEFDALNAETLRVLDMTKSIYDVARIEIDLISEQKSLREKVDVVYELERIIRLMNIIASEKQIKLVYRKSLMNFSIIGSRDMLARTIRNIVENAIKYSFQGSEIHIDLANIGTMGLLQVTDFGIGIPEEELKSIFERFTRASNVGDINGTGLGLSMVKEMVESMDGKITINSKLNEGTTVQVSFPLPG